MTVNALFGFFFQALIVLLGWWVVHTLTIRRDSAKARKEIISKSFDELAGKLNVIHDLAVDYHQKNIADRKAELKLKNLLDDFGTAIAMLCKLEPRIKAAEKHLVAVKLAATRFNFEVITSERITDNQIILDKLAQQVLLMKRFLLHEKYFLYAA